jgi:hypothetical protein
MRYITAVLITALTLNSAFAQDDQTQSPDPEKQALAYELQDCIGGKVRTTTQIFALRRQLETATKRAAEAEGKIAEALKRAEEAEAKLKSAGAAKEEQ